MANIVHIIGTGTIGEPLIGLFGEHRAAFGIDEITFHKRTPLIEERAKVANLIRRGAVLCVDEDRRSDFESLGNEPRYGAEEAIERATVVIDCTPAGLRNKEAYFDKATGPRGFMAQGSEFGFGKMYARGINDGALNRDEDRFLHIVSCNTHNMSALINSLAMGADGTSHLNSGRFLCIRRANDISQEGSFIPGPVVGKHDNKRFGTHHARDAHHLYETLGYDLPLWSSALKINTQYMHTLWFSLDLDHEITQEQARQNLIDNRRVAITYKRSANRVFSFGRDHGYFGRILSQTVIPIETVTVRDGHEVVGMCFTPQDGNALLSSVCATLWYMHPKGFKERLEALRPYLLREV